MYNVHCTLIGFGAMYSVCSIQQTDDQYTESIQKKLICTSHKTDSYQTLFKLAGVDNPDLRKYDGYSFYLFEIDPKMFALYQKGKGKRSQVAQSGQRNNTVVSTSVACCCSQNSPFHIFLFKYCVGLCHLLKIIRIFFVFLPIIDLISDIWAIIIYIIDGYEFAPYTLTSILILYFSGRLYFYSWFTVQVMGLKLSLNDSITFLDIIAAALIPLFGLNWFSINVSDYDNHLTKLRSNKKSKRSQTNIKKSGRRFCCCLTRNKTNDNDDNNINDEYVNLKIRQDINYQGFNCNCLNFNKNKKDRLKLTQLNALMEWFYQQIHIWHTGKPATDLGFANDEPCPVDEHELMHVSRYVSMIVGYISESKNDNKHKDDVDFPVDDLLTMSQSCLVELQQSKIRSQGSHYGFSYSNTMQQLVLQHWTWIVLYIIFACLSGFFMFEWKLVYTVYGMFWVAFCAYSIIAIVFGLIRSQSNVSRQNVEYTQIKQRFHLNKKWIGNFFIDVLWLPVIVSGILVFLNTFKELKLRIKEAKFAILYKNNINLNIKHEDISKNALNKEDYRIMIVFQLLKSIVSIFESFPQLLLQCYVYFIVRSQHENEHSTSFWITFQFYFSIVFSLISTIKSIYRLMFTNLFKRGLKKAFDFVSTSQLMTTGAIVTAATTSFAIKDGDGGDALQMLAQDVDGFDLFRGMDFVHKQIATSLGLSSDLCGLNNICSFHCCDVCGEN